MRLPGKKLRKEAFRVDSTNIEVELRVTDEGSFLGEIDGARFKYALLVDWRKAVQAHLEQTRRLTWEPVIVVEYLGAGERTRFHDERNGNRQEVVLAFYAAWQSRELTTSTRVYDGHSSQTWRRADSSVDPDTGEIYPLSDYAREHARAVSGHDKHAIPFTPDRWRRLHALADALANVRAGIADVLKDSTGTKLDALGERNLIVGTEMKLLTGTKGKRK